jgi:hypothetical protein
VWFLAFTVDLNSSAPSQPPTAPAKQEQDNDDNDNDDDEQAQPQRPLAGPGVPPGEGVARLQYFAKRPWRIVKSAVFRRRAGGGWTQAGGSLS